MYVLLLDEFGHEHAFDDRQCPVFGYGGLLLPAANLSSFSTQFFDFKIVAFRSVYKSRVVTRLKGEDVETSTGRFLPGKSKAQLESILQKMNKLKNDDLIKDPIVRRIAAQYEVKGADVFSSGYLTKLNEKIFNGKTTYVRRKSKFFKFAKYFLSIISDNDGKVFYYGLHKNSYPSLKAGERIHVELVKNVIEQANIFAKSRNTTLQVVFDHHHTDNERSTSQHGKHKTRTAQTREERATQIIINGGYYNNLTDPIFRAKSHLSQAIQAADWVCTLLKYLWVYRTEKKPEYLEFYDNLDRAVFESATSVSRFRSQNPNHQRPLYPQQLPFDFPPDTPPEAPVFPRPYQ